MPDYHPSVQQCMAQWQHNRGLLGKLEAEFNDWIVTVAFYTALHAVETLLKADASPPAGAPSSPTHGGRHAVLQGNPRYRTIIWPAYKVAYDLAHVTRYSAQPRRWTSINDIDGILFARALYPIETEVTKLLLELPTPIQCPPCPPIRLCPVIPPK